MKTPFDKTSTLYNKGRLREEIATVSGPLNKGTGAEFLKLRRDTVENEKSQFGRRYRGVKVGHYATKMFEDNFLAGRQSYFVSKRSHAWTTVLKRMEYGL